MRVCEVSAWKSSHRRTPFSLADLSQGHIPIKAKVIWTPKFCFGFLSDCIRERVYNEPRRNAALKEAFVMLLF